MRKGNTASGLVLILLGVAVLMRTVRGSLPKRVLQVAKS